MMGQVGQLAVCSGSGAATTQVEAPDGQVFAPEIHRIHHTVTVAAPSKHELATMRRSNSGAARTMPLALVDRRSTRSPELMAQAVQPRGVASSLTRLAILPAHLSSDSLLGQDLANLFDETSALAIVDPVDVGELKHDALIRSAADVLLLDARRTRPAVVYRAIVKIRAAGWAHGVVLMLEPADLAVVPVSMAVGATDFILSTAGRAEIEARLRREPARSNAGVPIAPEAAGIQLHWRSHQVSFEGTTISLTLRELQLLDVLLQSGRDVLTPPDLARLAWGASKEAAGALATTYVCSLRKKLAWFGGRFGIQTVRGVGYRFIV